MSYDSCITVNKLRPIHFIFYYFSFYFTGLKSLYKLGHNIDYYFQQNII